MMLDKKKIFFIVIGSSVLALFLWLKLLLLPQVGNFGDMMGKAGKVMAEVSAYQADIGRIDIFRSKLAEYDQKIAEYDSRLPKRDEIPSLLESLSAMARDSGVKIAAITPARSTDGLAKDEAAFYQDIPILITARSGYHELGIFINKIEKFERFMKIADVEIKANPRIPKRHDCELLILTYTETGGK